MPYQILNGAKIPIKIFVEDLSHVDSGALDQLRNTANLPWVMGVSAMPDVHLGKGATVGSVIVQQDALSPAVVGVDIGCVDYETEFLSKNGWVKISNYNNEEVLVYDLNKNISFFEKPTYIKEVYNDDFIYFDYKFTDQALTPDHRCLVYLYDRNYNFKETKVVSAEYISKKQDELKLGFRHRFRTDFPCPEREGLKLSEKELRLTVAACADGSYNVRDKDSTRCCFRFTKERKINRLKNLCDDLNIEYKISKDSPSGWGEKNGKEVTVLTINTPKNFKCLSNLYEATEDQLKIICDEVFEWDGNRKEKVFYSKDKKSADFVSYAFAATGFRSVLITDIRKDGELEYRVFANDDNIKVGIYGSPKTNTSLIKGDGFKYCFTTSTSYWVMRRNGRIVITGNCGMVAVLTPFKADQLKGDKGLRDLRSSIERDIPVGFNSNKSVTKRVSETFIGLGQYSDRAERFIDKARTQLGSLGSGNHFNEICLDKENRVWVMLHSGSRNIGKELAEYHIKTAKGLMGELVKKYESLWVEPELAALVVGTPEYQNYVNDLFWCQRFARANRDEMMKRTLKNLSYHVCGTEMSEDHLTLERVDCHHNYVSEEDTSFGKALVTRKGAVSARQGELGIIPGSMGQRRYIVRGKGNIDSFCSCSHGAGRRMSRGQAKKTFTLEDLAEQTKGVECRKDAGVLDEIPGAYKDIDQVMRNQEELVEIVAELKQVICIKG